ncbi:hypothetical protein PoB_002128800 [Plakobranchus ocellatus]|uniref:Uncharacterized protein n=1 Tax=Plakobranchus ocellatus TaxID=259542 RepID=A0AAV3ZJV2_9GAST|nr:hypothetical protein PoB_002128800 [Plakobranchus ocellatus]
MATPYPLSNRATDVRPGCKTQRIVPTLRQVADLVCAPTKETRVFPNMYSWTRELLPPVYSLGFTCGSRREGLCVELLCLSQQVYLIICVTKLVSWLARQRAVDYAWSRNGTPSLLYIIDGSDASTK